MPWPQGHLPTRGLQLRNFLSQAVCLLIRRRVARLDEMVDDAADQIALGLMLNAGGKPAVPWRLSVKVINCRPGPACGRGQVAEDARTREGVARHC